MTIPKVTGDPSEPDLSFASAMHKVRWAEQHIEIVYARIEHLRQEYVQRGGMIVSDDGERVGLQNFVIPPDILCEVGDAVFSLRSALDCCWMGLRRALNADQTKGTLPRALDRKGMEGEIKKAAMESAFAGITSTLLDQIRPYKAGNEILWFVAQVDNWNKHNMLVLAGQVTTYYGGGGINAYGGYSTLNNVTIVGFNNVPAIIMPTGYMPDNKPNIAVDIILKSRVPLDERHLMPFLRSALIDTRKAVEIFISKFGKQGASG